MKKRALIFSVLILSLITILPIVLAQNNETVSGDEIDAAYSCLKSQLGTNCGNTDSIEQLAFSLLAMGYDQNIQADCKSALINKEESDNSWKDENIKLTAQAIIALDYVGEDVSSNVDWLLSKREITEDLIWFLQIDADNATECEISVNEGSSRDFEVHENKKVSGSSSCLDPSASEQNYYFEIDEDCLNDNFTISCDKDFKTSVFYKKPGSPIYYISSETHSASAEGETQESVNSYCFGDNNCDYESSLWATLALAKLGEDTTPYLPYLSAESEEVENKKYIPSAFLYMLTNDDEYYSDLSDLQKSNNYWDESGKKFYDTALAILALEDSGDAAENAKDYLFEVQDNSGCWNSNNIRDTAFLLYAGWPKTPLINLGVSRSDCRDSGFFCVSSGLCTSSDTLSDYYCPKIGDVCCKESTELESCSEKQGIICDSDQRCTVSEVLASDTNYCCLGDCELVVEENKCESAGYVCKSSCLESQEEKIAYSKDCGFGEVCCGTAQKKESNMGLIILLIILIILVVLAIIFRNQLKIWFFRIKSKFRFGKGPKPSKRPPIPPATGTPQFSRPRQIIPRQPIRRTPMQRMPQRKPQKDTVFEETMKKLREISK